MAHEQTIRRYFAFGFRTETQQVPSPKPPEGDGEPELVNQHVVTFVDLERNVTLSEDDALADRHLFLFSDDGLERLAVALARQLPDEARRRLMAALTGGVVLPGATTVLLQERPG